MKTKDEINKELESRYNSDSMDLQFDISDLFESKEKEIIRLQLKTKELQEIINSIRIEHNNIYVSDAEIGNHKGSDHLGDIDKSLWQSGALWMRKELMARQSNYTGAQAGN